MDYYEEKRFTAQARNQLKEFNIRPRNYPYHEKYKKHHFTEEVIEE